MSECESERSSKIRLVERDYRVMKEIDRWRAITGKQITEVVGFSSQRTSDRRLKKLVVAGYICRRKILYGFPYLYSLTGQGKALINSPKYQEKFRIEQIKHDLAVVDTAIYFHKKLSVPYENILSEKELHRLDGFSKRRHRPDLVFTDKSQKKICAEVELSLKARDRFLKNIKDNFVGYDLQIWVVPSLRHKIAAILQEEQAAYNDIEILELKEVLSHGGNHQSTAPG